MTLADRWWCTLLLLCCALACRKPAARATRSAHAEVAQWSTPNALADSSGTAPALWGPSLAVWNGQLIVAGTVADVGSMVGRGALSGYNLAIESRPRAFDSLFGMYPRLAIDPGTGVRHLLWSEPAGNDSILWTTPGRSLWWAAISPSGDWSDPIPIVAGTQVHWAPTMSSQPVFGPDGTLHAAVALWSATTGNQVVHLALEPAGWRVTPVYTGTAAYTAIGVADNGDLAVAWVGQAQERDGSPSAAHVAFSADRGASWSAPMRLDAGRNEESGQLRLVGLRDSFLALWGRYGASTFPLAAIHRAVVRAGSRMVTSLPPIDPDYPIYGPEVVRDACGTTHLVVRHVTAASSHADYASLSYGIDTLEHVDPATTALELDIAAVAGVLTLAWVGRTATGEFETQVRTRPMLCGR